MSKTHRVVHHKAAAFGGSVPSVERHREPLKWTIQRRRVMDPAAARTAGAWTTSRLRILPTPVRQRVIIRRIWGGAVDALPRCARPNSVSDVKNHVLLRVRIKRVVRVMGLFPNGESLTIEWTCGGLRSRSNDGALRAPFREPAAFTQIHANFQKRISA